MTQKKLRVALLGFGGMGHCHTVNYKGQPDCKLVAIADINPEVFQVASENLNIGKTKAVSLKGIHTYGSYEELVKKETFDVLDICLPCPLHAPYAVKALKAGYHVLTEKPMGRTLAQADSMIRTARASGRFLMTAQVVRFMPHYRFAGEMLKSGKLGKILRISAWRNSGMPNRAWYTDGAQSGGALLDLHLHDLDFLQSLFGMPQSVFVQGITRESGCIDDLMACYTYADGLVASAEGSWCRDVFNSGLCAVCEKGTLMITGQQVKILRKGVKDPEIHDFAKEHTGYFEEIAYFARCVLEGNEPAFCSLESVRNSLLLARIEERAARSGRIVRL